MDIIRRWMTIGAQRALWALLALAITAGCAHQVALQDANYQVDTAKHDAGLVAVIEPDALNRKVAVKSFMTGIANTWEAEPGTMLKQVADVELPQMFAYYQSAAAYQEPAQGKPRAVLALSVPEYDFKDFRAAVTVRAVAYGPRKTVLFDKRYSEQGDQQGGKMFWAGAFGMKSAIRQSSLSAYRKIFARLRQDLAQALKL